MNVWSCWRSWANLLEARGWKVGDREKSSFMESTPCRVAVGVIEIG